LVRVLREQPGRLLGYQRQGNGYGDGSLRSVSCLLLDRLKQDVLRSLSCRVLCAFVPSGPARRCAGRLLVLTASRNS
jgi:hypothetical protein